MLVVQMLGKEGVDGRLRALAARATHAAPAWRRIAQVLRQQSMECFKLQRAPDGTPWDPLKESTLWARAFKRTKGYRSGLGRIGGRESKVVQRQVSNARILQDTGRLRASVAVESDDRSARIGSTLVYARTHQLGLRKKGIPARPFLGISPERAHEAMEILRKHLRGRG